MEVVKCNAANDPEVAGYIQDTMNQLLLNSSCDWGQLLSAGPSALCHLAQCVVVANSSKEASLVQIQKSDHIKQAYTRSEKTQHWLIIF
jgi:hypothetical protein